jgi:thiamine biosynthesis lipoprotein
VHRELEVMGTVVTIDLYGGAHLDQASLARSVDSAESVLREADETFSLWKHQSPMSRLRRGELAIGDAPAVIIDVLEQCRAARRASSGWFDPWSMPGGVDPTGLVKGWAAERALEPLLNEGLSGALINAAGDLASFGGPAPGEAFRVGVVRPDERTRLACIVETPGAVATSGTYERGNHLVNPFTGAASATASATVTGPNLGHADALATALALAGPSGLEFVTANHGYEGLVIDHAGAFCASDRFPMVECYLTRRIP